MEKKKNHIKIATKRIQWPTSAEMDELIDEFVYKFSQAYCDAFDEKMEEVDVEEFVLIIEEKLKKANQW